MKKAKIMLSAIAVVGILGTAFALNAHKYQNNFVYTGVTGTSSTACQTQLLDNAIGTSGTPNIYASTASLSSGCPLTVVTTVTGD
jgi:hypothetical protein